MCYSTARTGSSIAILLRFVSASSVDRMINPFSPWNLLYYGHSGNVSVCVCAHSLLPGKGRVSPLHLDLSYEVQEESALWLRLGGCLVRSRLTSGTH